MFSLETRRGKGRYWICESYKEHRISAAAFTSWYLNGKKHYEVYHVNGNLHRENGPAVTFWHSNGQKSREEYYVNGLCKQPYKEGRNG